MTWQGPQRHKPCHLITYGTKAKQCTSQRWHYGEREPLRQFSNLFSSIFLKYFRVASIVYTL